MTSQNYKVQKAFRLQNSFSSAAVLAALAPLGLDAAEIAAGQTVVEEAQLAVARPIRRVTRSAEYKSVVAWCKAWFPIAVATLEHGDPTVFETTFAGIERPSKNDAPYVASILAARLLGLASATDDPSKAAWARLAKHGFTVADLESVRAKIFSAESIVSPADADPTAEASREKKVERAWNFYLEWSKLARKRVKDKQILRMMGVHAPPRTASADAPAASTATPASPAAPATSSGAVANAPATASTSTSSPSNGASQH